MQRRSQSHCSGVVLQDDDPVFNDPAHDTNTCNFASEETVGGIQCQWAIRFSKCYSKVHIFSRQVSVIIIRPALSFNTWRNCSGQPISQVTIQHSDLIAGWAWLIIRSVFLKSALQTREKTETIQALHNFPGQLPRYSVFMLSTLQTSSKSQLSWSMLWHYLGPKPLVCVLHCIVNAQQTELTSQ